MTNEVEKIWTVQSEVNDGSNEVKANTSRVSTASAKQKLNNQTNQSSNNNNNNIKPGLNHLVGIQSRFQRNNYHKSLVVVLIFLLTLITTALIMSLYFGRNANSLCKTKDCLRASSNLLQSMDFTVNPCDDFYEFACGNWADDHPRPDSANSFDWFSEKQTKILRYIRSFLQLNGTASEPRAVNETRTMFKACMDTTQMDALGLQPVIDYLNEFHLPSYPTIISAENVESSAMINFDWIKSIAEIKKATSADIIVGFDIFPDPTNRTRNRIVLGTPETISVLPFKTDFEKRLKRLQKKNIQGFDEFVSHKNLEKVVNQNENDDDDDDDDNDTVSTYKSYMTEVMSAFVIFANPNGNLDVILPLIKQSTIKIIKTAKFLIELAEEAENITKKDAAFATEELINLSVDDFQNATDQAIAPNTMPIWCQYLGILFNSPQSMINLNDYLVLSSRADVYYLQRVMQFILDTPKIELELYIWWTIVEEMILHTTSDVRKLHNEYAKSITNLEGTTSRSLYCTSGVNQLMGMAVSYAIAQPNFLLITKPQVQAMIENIRLAFDHLVKEITWMDTGTKCSTLEKSHAMKSFVGFPEWILVDGKLDEFYTGIKFNKSTHLKNLIDVLRWQMNEKIKTLNSTEDLSWATTPTNVNAFHTFQANAITVPLAILQYPFYNLGIEALNYGAIGTILGHELTHGFDDSGRQFDKDGNMRQWWTNNTISEYINRTQCFIKQYDEYYIPEVEEHIDGELTLGENIADNGGLREAFYAYKLYTDKYGEESLLPGFENFSHEQLLFISFGNLWCETQTNIATKWALEDSHCPGRIRLKGVLANSDEFRNAFNCRPNSKMISKKQCRIW